MSVKTVAFGLLLGGLLASPAFSADEVRATAEAKKPGSAPVSIEVQNKLALAARSLGRGAYDEAILQYEAILAADPQCVPALRWLAWVLATCPNKDLVDPARALVHADKAYRLSAGKNPAAVVTLAVARGELKQFKEAIEVLQQRRPDADEKERKAIDHLLELFRSRQTYRKSILSGPSDATEQQRGRAESLALSRRALEHERTGDWNEAIIDYQQAADKAKAALGDDSPDYGIVLLKLGRAYRETGRLEDALRVFRDCHALFRRQERPDEVLQAFAANELGLACVKLGRYEEVLALHRDAPEAPRSATGEAAQQVLQSLNNLGMAQMGLCQWQAAADTLEKWLDRNARLRGPWTPGVADVRLRLGHCYCRLGQYARAERQLSQVLAAYELLRQRTSATMAPLLRALAYAYASGDDDLLKKSSAQTQLAVQICKARFGTSSPDVAVALVSMAAGFEDARKPAAAEPLLRQALRLLETRPGQNHPDALACRARLARACFQLHRGDEARRLIEEGVGIVERSAAEEFNAGCFERAVEMAADPGLPPAAKAEAVARLGKLVDALAERLGKDHASVTEARLILRPIAARTSPPADAERELNEGLALVGKQSNVSPRVLARSLRELGNLLRKAGKSEAAIAHFEEAVRSLEARPDEYAEDLADVLIDRGALRMELGVFADAETALRRAVGVLREFRGESSPNLVRAMTSLKELYLKQSQPEQADALARQIDEIARLAK